MTGLATMERADPSEVRSVDDKPLRYIRHITTCGRNWAAFAFALGLAVLDFLIQAQRHGPAPGAWCGAHASALNGFLLFGHCAACWLHAAAVGIAMFLMIAAADFAASPPAPKGEMCT